MELSHFYYICNSETINQKKIMRNLISFFLFLLTSLQCLAQFKTATVEVDSGFSCNTLNTAIFRNSAICTYRDTQFVVFYDQLGRLSLGKRALPQKGVAKDTFQIVKTNYRCKYSDAHRVASIGIDGDGYLHIAFDSHNSPLKYVMSRQPFSLELTEPLPMTSMRYTLPNDEEKDVTYPEFYRFSNGDLLFCYRNKNALVMNRYLLNKKAWRTIQGNLLENDYFIRPYWQVTVDANDVIHVSWTWRDKAHDTNTNHDIYYIRSRNYGVSWELVDGSPIQIPAAHHYTNPVWPVPMKSNLINQTSMTTDKNGNPYIASYWEQDSITNYRLVYFDGSKWNCTTVSNRKSTFKLSGIGTLYIPIARPRLVTNGEYIYYLTRDADLGSVITMYYAKIQDGKPLTFKQINLTKESVEAWEPCIDTELWKQSGKLHIFVQRTYQETNEGMSHQSATMVKVMEVKVK